LASGSDPGYPTHEIINDYMLTSCSVNWCVTLYQLTHMVLPNAPAEMIRLIDTFNGGSLEKNVHE